MVSLSTRLKFAPRPDGSGKSPGREADTVPLISAPRNMLMALFSQKVDALRKSSTASRRRAAIGGSATWLSSRRAPWSTAWTTLGKPLSSPST